MLEQVGGVVELELEFDVLAVGLDGLDAQVEFLGDAARADALARTALPRGETVNNADRQLGERLARLRGAGLGFSGTAASVVAAVGAAPGAELRALSFDGTGRLRATVAVQNEGLITDITQRLRRQGFTVTQSTAQNIGGVFSVDLTVGAS